MRIMNRLDQLTACILVVGCLALIATRRNGAGMYEVARVAGGVEEAFELLKGKLTGELKANNQKIVNLALPSADGDAVCKAYCDIGKTNSDYKSTNQIVNNSTVLVDISDLDVSVEPNGRYIVQAFIRHLTGATPDIKFGWTVPSGGVDWWTSDMMSVAAANDSFAPLIETDTHAINGAGAIRFIEIHAILKIDATGGTAHLQFAQNVANASDTIVTAGSTLVAWKVS